MNRPSCRTARPGLVALLAVLAVALPARAARAQGDGGAILAAARRATASGRPWQASRLLAPLLASPGGRTPDVLLAAADAAAGWEGWTTVQALLRNEPWLDRVAAAEGRALLARAALERRQDADALREARAAVRGSPDDAGVRGRRLVLLARALDRAGQLDSAAQAYRDAAAALPGVRDWLFLRAAGVSRDSASRATLYRQVALPAASARIGWTEALALERSGDAAAAGNAYENLGARLAAIRVRLAGSPTPRERDALRAQLRGALNPAYSAADNRSAIGLLDQWFRPLTADEQLAVARRAAAIGMLERASQAFAALPAPRLTDRDRLTWGTVLARLGRHDEAIAQFGEVRAADLAGRARYQATRSRLATGGGAISERLLQIADSFPADTEAASSALFLAGDLAVDRGDDATARRLWRRLGDAYPTSTFAPRARFQSAIIAFVAGTLDSAAAEFAGLGQRLDEAEAWAATYWLGRTRLQAGDTVAARLAWRRLVEKEPNSYYGLLAARRMDLPPRLPSDEGGLPAPTPDLVAALDRADLLQALGMGVEARLELDRVVAEAGLSTERLLMTGAAFVARGAPWRVAAMANRAVTAGAGVTRALLRLVYPLPWRESLEAEAAEKGLAPGLVAGVIRQESAFDPRATSVADARGLMQVLPSVGARMARTRGYDDWDAVLLYQPEVAIDFGTEHLADGFARFADPARVLAAYNAGVERVERWNRRAGVDRDQELFIERIPFVETRGYVRAVLRNQRLYEALYGWDRAAP